MFTCSGIPFLHLRGLRIYSESGNGYSDCEFFLLSSITFQTRQAMYIWT